MTHTFGVATTGEHVFISDSQRQLLSLVRDGGLPACVDEQSAVSIRDLDHLVKLGLVDAKVASADMGICYLEPQLRPAGEALLRLLA